MSIILFYYVAIVCTTFFLVITISYMRGKLGSKIFRPLVIQPYAGNVIKKNYFLGLAFLESPLILTDISAISFSDLLEISAQGREIITLIPFFYTILSGVSAAISIYFTGLCMYYFFKIFGAHPQYDSSLLMQLIIFSSTLQAPFILFMVSLFIHKSFFFALTAVQMQEASYFIFFHLTLLLFVQFGVMRNIKKILKELSFMYRAFPEYIKELFITVLMQLGFLQAPYIFSFVCFLLLLQVYAKVYVYKVFIFSSATFLFSFIAYLIINSSGKIASTAIKNIDEKEKKNTSLINTSLLAQIILDSRIIYMLVILLIFISTIS